MSRYDGRDRYEEDSFYVSDDENVHRYAVVDDLRPANRAAPAWIRRDHRRADSSGGMVRRTEEDYYTLHGSRRPASQNPPAYYEREQEDFDTSRVRFIRRDEFEQQIRPRMSGALANRDREYDQERLYVSRNSRDDESTYTYSSDDYFSSDTESETRVNIRHRSSSRPAQPVPPVAEPAPPAAPVVINGPTIQREVVTHYTNIDHGTIDARPPPPAPVPVQRPARSRSRSRHHHAVEIDIDHDDRSVTEDGTYLRVSHRRSRRDESTDAVRGDTYIDSRYTTVPRVACAPGREERVFPVMMPSIPPPPQQQLVPIRQDTDSLVVGFTNRRTDVAQPEMWTRIKRGLVSRSALRSRGYRFEVTKSFLNVAGNLNHADIAAMVRLTKEIRREKKHIRKADDYVRHRSRHRGRDRGEEVYGRERSVSVHRSHRRVHV